MLCHKLGELPGTTFVWVARLAGVAGALLPAGSGLICLPTTTNRFKLVPGGSQVMRLAVAVKS